SGRGCSGRGTSADWATYTTPSKSAPANRRTQINLCIYFLLQSLICLFITLCCQLSENSDINPLAAGRLMTMDRDRVVAGPKRPRCLLRNLNLLVIGNETLELRGNNTIQVDVGVFVVIHAQFHRVQILWPKDEFGPQPDIGCFP